jgi:hypothetical protein
MNIADMPVFRSPSMPRIPRPRSCVGNDHLSPEMRDGTRWPMTLTTIAISEPRFLDGVNRRDRRRHGNHIRGGIYRSHTRVTMLGGLVEAWALRVGWSLDDRRMWVNDAAWEHARWIALCCRSVDGCEDVSGFWKPGMTTMEALGGSGVWNLPSVLANDDHQAPFPVELPAGGIRLLTAPDDTVRDCVMGSGTMAVAAIRAHRHICGKSSLGTICRLGTPERIGSTSCDGAMTLVLGPENGRLDGDRRETMEHTTLRLV